MYDTISYNDPFQTTTILSFDKFIDRKRIIESVLGKIRTGGHTSIIGERRTGKSSILRYLTFPDTREIYGSSYGFDEFLVIYLDPQDTSIVRPQEFVGFIFREAEAALDRLGFSRAVKQLERDLHPSLEDLNEFIYRVKKKTDFKIVLLIDEFEYFCKGTYLGEAFFKKLRALGDKQYLLYVTCSGRTLEALTRETKIAGSEFWNIFTNEFVDLFSEAEVDELITRYLSLSNTVTFSQADYAFVKSRIGGHPYFVQRACSELYSFRFRNRDVNPDYAKLFEKLLLDEWQRLGAYFRSLTDYQRSVILSFVKEPSTLKSYIDTVTPNLIQSAIIVRKNGAHELFSPLFHEYLTRNTSSVEEQQTASRPNVEGIELLSGADEDRSQDSQPTPDNQFIVQAKEALQHKLDTLHAEVLSDWRDKEKKTDAYVLKLEGERMQDVEEVLAPYRAVLEEEMDEIHAVYRILSSSIDAIRDGAAVDRIVTLLSKGWPRLHDVR